jgi:hypothetical protein
MSEEAKENEKEEACKKRLETGTSFIIGALQWQWQFPFVS